MLPKENRLKKSTDFDKIYKKRQFFGTKFINFNFFENSLPVARAGFVVSTKVSKSSAKRNLLKRRMREVVRLNLAKIKPGFDIIISAKPGASGMEYGEIEQNILWALRKAGLIKSEARNPKSETNGENPKS